MFLLLLGFFQWKRKSKQEILSQINQRYGLKGDIEEESLELIRIYDQFLQKDKGSSIDEVTWQDLDMDRIYSALNQTQTSIGEQILYHQLHLLEQADLDPLVEWMHNHESQRLKLQWELMKMGKYPVDYSLVPFIKKIKEHTFVSPLIVVVLQLFLFGSFILGLLLSNEIFYGIGMGVATLNILIYLTVKSQNEQSLLEFGAIHRMLIAAEKVMGFVIKEKPPIVGVSTQLNLLKSLKRLTRGIKSSQAWNEDMLDMLHNLWAGITLSDLTKYRKITQLLAKQEAELMAVHHFLGQLDMSIAIASFRQSLPYFCVPCFHDERKFIINGLIHPMLENPVANDLSFDQSCIITGSNASGKSTLIKAVAVNAILAQTILTCAAKSFSLPRIHVMTSMAIRDDLAAKESYYMKELRYLKRMVMQAKKGLVLCVIDEILRGTNDQERKAASQAILTYLNNKGALVLVASHDFELVDALSQDFRSLSFHSTMKQNQLFFDYQLHEGNDHSQNAIALLRSTGFCEAIVQQAEALSQKGS